MSSDSLPQQTWDDVIERQRRIAGQHDALDMFMFLRQNDPDFRAEEHRNRARMACKGNHIMADLYIVQPKGSSGLWHYCSRECAEHGQAIKVFVEATVQGPIPEEEKVQHIGPLAKCMTCGKALR